MLFRFRQRPLKRALRRLMRLLRVLHRLPRVFVPRLMFPFCVTCRRRSVRVRRLFVQFSSPLM